MLLSSGAAFAGYTIVRLVCSDATGEVYLAEHPRLARRDALRVLPAALSADAEFRGRFIRAADAASALDHPHIVKLHDRGEFDGRLWVAMDYVDGPSAEQLIAERFPDGLPPGQALAVVAAIAEALDYAHHRGVLHRDVRPGNILLTGSKRGTQRIMLAGFGVARQAGLGAVAYAAPEQLIGTDIDGRADQYALASTAFHLLTGAPPFAADDPVSTFSRKLAMAPPPLSDRSPKLASLEEVMSTALARDPADRFGDCREFAEALSKRVAKTTGIFGIPVRPLPRIELTPGTHRRPRWRWIGLASAMCMLSAAVLLAVGMVHEHDDDAAGSTATAPERPNGPTQTTTPASSRPVTPPQLNGTYRVDANRSHQTFNDIANPQPPDVTTWWAFRSACPPAGCVAAGVILDDSRQIAGVGANELRLDFIDGHWKSRPLTARYPCVDTNGRAGMQTRTEILSLRSPDHGLLRGELTVTVETNECGQQGAVIRVPTAAARTGDLPPGVAVPDPAAPAVPTPTR